MLDCRTTAGMAQPAIPVRFGGSDAVPANVLTTRREGRFVYYRLRDPRYLDLVQIAGDIAGVSKVFDDFNSKARDSQACVCPQCEVLASPVAT